MKHNNSPIRRQLLTVLAFLLLAAPGAWAQGGTNHPLVPTPNPVAMTSPASKGHIVFHGQTPGNTNYGHVDPLDLCPNTYLYGSGDRGWGQPYQFEFDTQCRGNTYSGSAPPFIWTVKYLTEDGNFYQEQWQDGTLNDYSKVQFYLFDRVPSTLNDNLTATQNGGNNNVSAWLPGGQGSTAQPGEIIVGIRLECTGYSCLVSDDNDGIDVRYFGRRPDALSLNGAALPLCRNQVHTVSTDAVLGASGYSWTASNGATILGAGGTNTTATLSLGNVAPSTNSITLRVAALDYNNCGATAGVPRASAYRTLVVSLAPGPTAPQNLQLSNGGLCPTTGTDTKGVSINLVTNAVRYRWTISGPATFDDGTTAKETIGNSAQIKTPQVGKVTVTAAVKLSDCNSYSIAISRTFQIGNLEPVCVQPGFQRGPCDFGSFSLAFETTPTGLNYYFGAIRNVTNGGTPTITQSRAGSPVFLVDLGNGPSGRFSFDLEYYVQSPCPSGPGFIACTTNISVGKFVAGHCRPAPTPAPTKGPELFPNPTSGTVEIRSAQPTGYQWLKVYDMKGSLRHEEHSEGGEGIQSFDIRSLATGLYQVQLFDGQHLATQRLIKE